VLGEVRQDLWGLFDVVGIAKKEILFVQVKTNLKLPKDISKSENKLIRDIREFKNKYEIKQARYVIAVRFDGNSHKKVEWIEYEI
jgi:Holliday junction resolvase